MAVHQMPVKVEFVTIATVKLSCRYNEKTNFRYVEITRKLSRYNEKTKRKKIIMDGRLELP